MNISSDTMRRIQYIICLVVVLYVMKPTLFFKPNGKPRQYGIGVDDEGYKKTLYTFQFAILILAVMLTLLC